MAREAGFNPVTFMGAGFELFEHFAALVAEAEREACAQVCESDVGILGKGDLGEFWADKCAAAIRERGSR